MPPKATTGPGLAEREGAPYTPEGEGGSCVTGAITPGTPCTVDRERGVPLRPHTIPFCLEEGLGEGPASALTCHHQRQEVTPL